MKKSRPAQRSDSHARRLEQALAFHRNGHLPQACQLYEAILAADARHAGALHYCGVARLQLGDAASGVALMERALEAGEADAALWINLGNGRNALGRHAQAIEAFGAALALQPGNPDALNNLGLARAAGGDPAAALASYEEALALRPAFSACHANRANALRALGRHDEAVAACEQALRLAPGHPDTLNNLGLALAAAGREDEALACFGEALSRHPRHLKLLRSRGQLLLRRGEHALALADFEALLSLPPPSAEDLVNAGLARQALGRQDEALAAFDAALEIRPDAPEALNNRGNALLALARPDEAIESFRKALAARSDFPEALNNLANLLAAAGCFGEALAFAEEACRLAPALAEGHNNRGLALDGSARPEEAVAALDEALRLRPDYTEALNNRACAHDALGRHEAALADFDRALEIQPGYADAQWNKALALLRREDYAAAWPLYEARWALPGRAPAHVFAMPRWQGEALAGRTLLVWSEQGFGDSLQFCRYLPLLAARGVRVLFETQAPLAGLMRSVAGVAQVIARGEAMPQADYHCPLLSLPGLLGTDACSIPAQTPYLSADPARLAYWRERLPEGPRLRVAIVCAGNPQFTHDAQRSMPLVTLLPLLELEADFHWVQPECRLGDEALLSSHPRIIDLRGELHDFADTAAALSRMDLVISSCTSVAHLAGALRRPLWLMLAQQADWRWLADREDSPWYPEARLFRQTMRGDWAGVVACLRASLAQLIEV